MLTLYSSVVGTLRWCRFLFDYFKSKGTTPALVEAVDFIHNTKPTMNKLCHTIGIDPEGIKDSWYVTQLVEALCEPSGRLRPRKHERVRASRALGRPA